MIIKVFLLILSFNISANEKASQRLLKGTKSLNFQTYFLFDINEPLKIKSHTKGKILPNRVYLKKNEEKWGYSLTNQYGEFETPLEFLRADTVLSGDYLGGKKDEKYLLTPEGKWIRTFKNEIQFFWVMEKSPKIKIQTYLPVTKTLNKGERIVYEKNVLIPSKTKGIRKFSPKLYDVETDTLTENDGKLLPQRVYAVYVNEKRSWFFTLTTKKGDLTKPLEVIYYNTVLPGKFLGVKNTFQNYRFTKKWGWVATRRNVESFYWVLSSPQVFKRVMFFEPLEASCPAK